MAIIRTPCISQHPPPVKNWRILLEQSFAAHMPLLMTSDAFELGRRH